MNTDNVINSYNSKGFSCEESYAEQYLRLFC